MRLGGTVCFNHPDEWEEKLVASRFRAITAPFTCETPKEEIRRLCRIAEKHDAVISEVGVWKNVFDAKEGRNNLDYAVRQLRLADELGVPCCVNVAGTEGAAGRQERMAGYPCLRRDQRRKAASCRTGAPRKGPRTRDPRGLPRSGSRCRGRDPCAGGGASPLGSGRDRRLRRSGARVLHGDPRRDLC